jgi:hypothetical protein
MYDLPLQSLQANDLLLLQTKSDRFSPRIKDRTDGTNSFSHELERASARQTLTEEEHDDLVQQPAVERNRAEKENDPQTVNAAPVKEHRTEKEQQIDQDPGASPQSSAQPGDVAAGSAAQQAPAAATPPAKEAQEQNVEVTISWTGSGDDLKVSAPGLPEELLTALLSALGNGSGTTQAVTPGTAKQADDSGLNASGLTPDGKVTLTLKVALDPTDALKGTNQIASLIQAITDALQKKVSEMVELDPGQTPTADLKASGPLAQLLLKDAPADDAPSTPVLNQGLTAAFKNLVSRLGTQDAQFTKQTPAQATTSGSVGASDLNSLNPIMNGAPEVKLPQGTDLTESLLSKVKITISLPGVVEGANGTADKGAGLPFEGNGKSGFGEQGTTMQTGVQRQEPLVESSTTTSFGSIVADRLAAVAEQVGLRDKPLDITLRLNMEGGESLLVGLKDQAGKMIVQVRCADESMVSLLESQKETIVRHLEAKQISSTISISPIEEDLTRRQGRERPKNTWGRRPEPSNPFIETSI